MPEAPKGKSTYSRGAGRDQERSENTIAPLQVRYYRRMSSRRVYGVSVSWPKSKDERRAPAGTPPVTVRLLMAGAQVVPSEQTLDPADPGAKATFYVTPLAKGWLRGERLEILVGGRKVQEVALPAKVGSQRATCVLLLLALLVPWLLLSYGKYSPLTLSKVDVLRHELFTKTRDKGGLREIDKARILRADNPGREAPNVDGEFGKITPGDILRERIAHELPSMPGFIDDSVPAVRDGLVTFRGKIGDFYDNLLEWTSQYPIAFYVFAVFLVLALISFIVNQDKRKKRASKAIPIPRSGVDGPMSRREEVVAADMD